MLSTRHVPALTFLLVLAMLAALAWPFTVDDAFIVVRYAARLARGSGYTFSGQVQSDGVTGPAWLLPLILGAWLRLDLISLAKGVSLAAGAVAGLSMLARVRGLALGRHAVWLALGVLLSSLPFVAWSVAGLETGAAAACATLLALACTARPRANGRLAGACLAGLAWLRPELLAFGGLLALSLSLRADRRAVRETWLLGALGLISVLGFRYALFAHFLPLSASAKPALLGNGASYLLATLARPRVWLLLPLLMTAFVQGGRTARTLLLALAVHALAVLLVGGDWMPGRRLFAPIVPVLALALALGLRPLLARRPRSTWSLLGLLIVLSGLELAPELAAMREAGATREQNAPALAKLVCAARGPVAIVDLGLVAALCPAQSFLDLGGLTDGEVASMRGAHLDKQIDPVWLRAHAPGLVVLHSRDAPRVDELGRLRWFAGYPVERRVLAAPFLRDYRVTSVLAYAPHYFYVLLAPPALPEVLPGARSAP